MKAALEKTLELGFLDKVWVEQLHLPCRKLWCLPSEPIWCPSLRTPPCSSWPVRWSQILPRCLFPLSQYITFWYLLVLLLSCQPTALAVITCTNLNPKQALPPQSPLFCCWTCPDSLWSPKLTKCPTAGSEHCHIPPLTCRTLTSFFQEGLTPLSSLAQTTPLTGRKWFLPVSTRLLFSCWASCAVPWSWKQWD